MNLIITTDVIWAINILIGAFYIYPNEKKGFWKWFGVWCVVGGIIHFLIN